MFVLISTFDPIFSRFHCIFHPFLTGLGPAGRQRSWSWASCCPRSPPSEQLHLDGWCTPWRCPRPQQQRWSRGSRRWSWCPGGWSTWRPGRRDLTSNWQTNRQETVTCDELDKLCVVVMVIAGHPTLTTAIRKPSLWEGGLLPATSTGFSH